MQVRYLTRIITAEDYDAAARLRPETCPMHYMGDRRTGRQLLADFPADAAVTVAALARRLAARPTPGGRGGGDFALVDFGAGGGAEAAACTLGVPFLGRIPLTIAIREASDAGRPPAAGNGPEAQAFHDIAAKIADWLKA